MSEHLLTLREAAERMGLSIRQLRELARTGQLPASKHAGRWLIEAAEADAHQAKPSAVVRGRLAQSVAMEDMLHGLQHEGVVVAEPDRGGLPGQGLPERAHAAQAEALDHMQRRLDRPQIPERSV